MQTVKGNWGSIFKAAMDEKGISADRMSKDLQIPKRTIHAYLLDTEPTATRFCQITNYLDIKL